MAVTTDTDPKALPIDQQSHLARVLPDVIANRQVERLREMQDDIFERALRVVDGATRFAEIAPDATEPPAEWIYELGKEQAMVRFRAAQAGWMNVKTSPVGIKVATTMASSILKARALENTGSKTLNVQVVHWSGPVREFPEQEIEPDR